MLRKSSLQNPWFRDSVLDTLYIFLQKRTLRIWRMGTARKKKMARFSSCGLSPWNICNIWRSCRYDPSFQCDPVVPALVCFSGQCRRKPLIVASDATWPPIEMLDENKNVVGYSIDYLKAVAKEAG